VTAVHADSPDDEDDPFEEWRERVEDDPFLGPFFADLDREFERMRDSLSRMLDEMDEDAMGAGDPFVYGFSLRMGPDGDPQFNEFGNVKGDDDPRQAAAHEAREPLVDIQETDDRLTLTAELPGVEKDDVNLRAKQDELIVQAVDDDNRFFKRIDLPTTVEPSTTEATYKNGVLDIQVDKAPDREEGTEIDID